MNRTDTLMVIKKLSALRGTGIIIKEDISQANRHLLNKVINTEGISPAWTDQVKVLGKYRDGRIRKFDRDIKTAISNYEKQHEASEKISIDQAQDSILKHPYVTEWMNDAPRDQRVHKKSETYRKTDFQGLRGQNRGFRGHSQGIRGHNQGFRGQHQGFRGLSTRGGIKSYNWNPATDYAFPQ